MGSRPRAQSPSSVNKTSQWQLACVLCIAHPAPQRRYKRRARADAHQLFASEPSLFSESPRVSTDSKSQCWCYGASAGVVVQCCCFLMACCSPSNCGHASTSPGRFSTFSERVFLKEQYLKELHERRASFLKMASRSCVSGCGRFLASSDDYDRCVSWISHVLIAGTWPSRSPAAASSSILPGGASGGH